MNRMNSKLLSALLLFLGLALATQKAEAQSLKFSRVLLLQLTAPANDTVPAGHVWKLENSSVNSNSKGAHNIALNGIIVATYNQFSSNSAAYHAHIGPTGPIWMPAGTVLAGATNSLTYTFSIVEFEVVP